jgi:hypothetical protein
MGILLWNYFPSFSHVGDGGIPYKIHRCMVLSEEMVIHEVYGIWSVWSSTPFDLVDRSNDSRSFDQD